MRPPKTLSLILVALLLGGCASRTVSLAAVAGDGDLASRGAYILESAEGREGSVQVTARGERDIEFGGRSVDAVRFVLAVDNSSDDPLGLPLRGMSAVDDTGHRLPLLATFLPPDSSGDPAVVPGRTRTSMEVLFECGSPGTLRTLGSVSLEWSYEFRGASIPHQTRFLPFRYVQQPAAFHYGFGFGYGSRFGFGRFGPWGRACW